MRACRLISVACLLALWAATDAAGQSFEWARRAGGGDHDGATAVGVDAAGNSYVLGTFRVQATFGDGQVGETVLNAVCCLPSQDIFVAKYRADGTLAWARGIGGTNPESGGDSGEDRAWGIAVDASGNSYITGTLFRFSTLVDFGNDVTLRNTGGGAFVALFDTDGRATWATFLGEGEGFGIDLDEAGNSYVTGVAPDPALGGGIPTTWKIGPEGTLAWRRQMRGDGGVGLGVAALDTSGGVVTGRFVGTMTLEPVDSNPLTLTAGNGSGEAFVARYDELGNLLWATQFVSTGGAWGEAIAADAAGNSYVTGPFIDSTTVGTAPASVTLTAFRLEDMFIAKYDVDGAFLWVRQVTGAGSELPFGAAVDANGNPLVAGFTGAQITFAPGEPNQVTLNSGFVFVAKYTADGGLMWALADGRPGAPGDNGGASGVAVDEIGRVYVSGTFVGQLTFGVGQAETTVTSTGGADAFMLKFVPDDGPPNTAPVAWDASITTMEDTAAGMTLSATDADGDALDFAIVVAPSHGTLTGTAPDLVYTPHPDYHGPDRFSFQATDGAATSNTATVSVTVTPVNDRPIAFAQTIETPQDTAVVVTLTGQDVDGDSLVFAVSTPPAHGSLSGLPPNLTYTPETGYAGPDAFAFTASDGALVSQPALVSVMVRSAALPCGMHAVGRIDRAGEVDVFTFAGQAGQLISLALASTGGFAANRGSGSAQVQVVSPAGVVLVTLRSNSQATVRLPNTGTYEFRVRAANLVTTGGYALNIECLFPAASPDTVLLTCGDTRAGEIASAAEVDLFSFAGVAGQVVSIALASVSGFAANRGSGSAQLDLFAPDGAIIGSLRSNSQAQYELPRAGTYLMRVNAANLANTGRYAVNVECLAPTPSPDAVPLTCGGHSLGRIDTAAEVDLFTFVGGPGQIVSLTLASTGGFAANRGSGSVQLQLFAPDGALVGTLRSNSQANYALTAAGTYVIRINAANLAAVGGYAVNLECLVPGPSPDAVALTCGSLATGRIDLAGEADLFSFAGAAGQRIALTLSSTGGFAANRGSGSAELQLFASTGVLIGTLRSNSLVTFGLPADGLYVIRVTAANLSTTGGYAVNLECLAPEPSPDAIALSCGRVSAGRIESAAEADLFALPAEGGTTVTVTIASTGGFAGNRGSGSAQLDLYSPFGERLGSIRSNTTASFGLPWTGTYVIVVSAANLASKGSYEIRLSCP